MEDAIEDGMHESPIRSHGLNSQDPSGRMEAPNADRISGLPESLLQDILSFVPSQEVVRTSVLSQQWKNIWATVPCLRVDASKFSGNHDKFSNFVSRLLQRRGDKSPLKVFCVHNSRSEEANSWLSYAIDHCVESLEFSVDRELKHFILDTRTMDFSSSSLKRLVLSNVHLAAVHFSQLNYHCPNLQILELKHSHLQTTVISSSSLISLDIWDCCICADIMIVRAPRLTSLKLRNIHNYVISLEELPSLVQASITLDSRANFFDDDDEGEVLEYNIFRALSHCRIIELLAPPGERLFEDELLRPREPLFSNLTSLTLGMWCMVGDFYPIAWFLQCAPLLKELTLNLMPPQEEESKPGVCVQSGSIWDRVSNVFPVVESFEAACLSKVKIYCYKVDPEIRRLIRLLSAAKPDLEIETHPTVNSPPSEYWELFSVGRSTSTSSEQSLL